MNLGEFETVIRQWRDEDGTSPRKEASTEKKEPEEEVRRYQHNVRDNVKSDQSIVSSLSTFWVGLRLFRYIVQPLLVRVVVVVLVCISLNLSVIGSSSRAWNIPLI